MHTHTNSALTDLCLCVHFIYFSLPLKLIISSMNIIDIITHFITINDDILLYHMGQFNN